jgi:hypothetical protein
MGAAGKRESENRIGLSKTVSIKRGNEMMLRRIASLAAGVLIVFGVSTVAANAVTAPPSTPASHYTVQADPTQGGPEPTPSPTSTPDGDVTWGG